MSINTLDIVFIAIITLFIVRCYVKGLVSEVLSMAAVVLGILAAVFFYKNGAAFVRTAFLPNSKGFADVIAFVGLFLIVFILVKIIELTVKGIIERIRLSGIDRFLGIFFGLIEGITLVCFILFLLQIQPVFDVSGILAESFLARLFLPLITGRKEMVNV